MLPGSGLRIDELLSAVALRSFAFLEHGLVPGEGCGRVTICQFDLSDGHTDSE